MTKWFPSRVVRNYDGLFKERFIKTPPAIVFETRLYELMTRSPMDFYGDRVLIYRNEPERHTIKIQVDQDGYVQKAFVFYQNTCEKGILQ